VQGGEADANSGETLRRSRVLASASANRSLALSSSANARPVGWASARPRGSDLHDAMLARERRASDGAFAISDAMADGGGVRWSAVAAALKLCSRTAARWWNGRPWAIVARPPNAVMASRLNEVQLAAVSIQLPTFGARADHAAMANEQTVRVDTQGPVTIVTIDRPEVRNAVNPPTAAALAAAFRAFDAEPAQRVAILTGASGCFCAGYDLKVTAAGHRAHRSETGDGPMGPTRMKLGKPVIAAVEGPAVAGGLELALWCDLRIAARNATFGVYCRRFGVPLMDLGTVRLPRLIGHSRAMDLILTGRGISGEEAERIGLANRVSEPGRALQVALELAHQLSDLPQAALRSDRLSAIAQWDLDWDQATLHEYRLGIATVASGETEAGARRFAAGVGRHGKAV
jgi:enoyl-CoA hydratase